MADSEKAEIIDKQGFVYYVNLEYFPSNGFANAKYYGQIIAQVELTKVLEPISDSDYEWELYESILCEWTDEIKINIIPKCVMYFNSKL